MRGVSEEIAHVPVVDVLAGQFERNPDFTDETALRLRLMRDHRLGKASCT